MKKVFAIMLTSLLGMFIALNYANACSDHEKGEGKSSTEKKAKTLKKHKKITKEEALKQEDKDKGLYE